MRGTIEYKSTIIDLDEILLIKSKVGKESIELTLVFKIGLAHSFILDEDEYNFLYFYLQKLINPLIIKYDPDNK